MVEVFSDDLNLIIGDLLSHPLSLATRPPCARPFMLTRPIQAHTYMFARAPVHACAPASPAHPLLQAIFFTPSFVYFRNPKVSQSINTLNPLTPLNPSPGKNT